MVLKRTARKNEWNSRKYERVTLMVKAGDRGKLKAAAAAAGISVNRLVIDSINARHPGLLSPLDDTSKQQSSSSSSRG